MATMWDWFERETPMKWDYDDLFVEAFLRIAYKKAHQLDLFREKITIIMTE